MSKEQLEALASDFEYKTLERLDIEKSRGRHRTRTYQMIRKYGGRVTAQRLLNTKEPQTGLLDIPNDELEEVAIEELVLMQKYQPLFGEIELGRARDRLAKKRAVS